MHRLLILAVLFIVAAFAEDVTGTWKGTAETPNGTIERTFVFKADGNKLSGETSSEMMGKSTITDGKIDGDEISFTIQVKFQDNEMKLNYKGKVADGKIQFHVESDSGIALDYSAKRIS